MTYLIEHYDWWQGSLLSGIVVFLRYLLTAGPAFLILYVWYRSRFLSHKIQARFPGRKKIWMEIRHSAVTALVFALMGVGIYGLRQAGWTQIYEEIGDFGWGYLLGSVAGLILLHDTYFYWMHRLMHHPRVFPFVHRVHHLSHNPTPWAALSFHPLEAVLEIGIVPLAVILFPIHPLALLLFASWSLLWNVLGHSGYEWFPSGFVRHPFGRWLNTPTHHNLHHQQAGYNFGLYFNFWDRLLGTNHPQYEERFEEICRKKNQQDFDKNLAHHTTQSQNRCSLL